MRVVHFSVAVVVDFAQGLGPGPRGLEGQAVRHALGHLDLDGRCSGCWAPLSAYADVVEERIGAAALGKHRRRGHGLVDVFADRGFRFL